MFCKQGRIFFFFLALIVDFFLLALEPVRERVLLMGMLGSQSVSARDYQSDNLLVSVRISHFSAIS